MQSCTILTILMVGILFTLTTCKIEGPPRDTNGEIICKPDDPICEKMKQMLESPNSFYFRRDLMNRAPFRRRNGREGLKCDSEWAKKLCESMDKTCYADGKCGELVNEEKLVFDE